MGPSAASGLPGYEHGSHLLDGVATVLRPGGVLVYAVCTVTAAEGEERVRAFLQRHPEFELDAVAADSPAQPYVEELDGVQATVRLWPHRHGVDGFFGARLRRRV